MIAVLFILVALHLNAAITSVTVQYDEGAGEVRGLQRGTQPHGGRLVITGSNGDAWSVTKGTCNDYWTKPTSGTLSGTSVTITFGWSMVGRSISAGANSGTVTCTGSVSGINFTLNGRAYRMERPLFVTSYLGQADSAWSTCDALTISGGVQYDLYRQNCAANSSYPPSDGVALPAVCATWTDPLWGGIWKHLSTGARRPYSGSHYSRDSRYLFTDAGIIDTTNCALITGVYTGGSPVCASSSIGNAMWDHTDKAGYSGWCLPGNDKTLVKRWTLSGTISDGGTSYTHPVNIVHDGTNTGNGGTGIYVSGDGWFPFHDADGKVWIINLKNTSEKYSATAPYMPRSVRITPYPDWSGTRFMHIIGALLPPGNVEADSHFYLRPGAASLVQGPSIARADQGVSDNAVNYNRACTEYVDSSCIGAGHNSEFWLDGVTGRIGSSNGSAQIPFTYQQTAIIFSTGADASKETTVGGGRISVTPHGSQHYAVAALDAPIAVWTDDPGDDNTRGLTCSGDGTTVTCTVAAPPNPDGTPNLPGTNVFAVSDRVLLNGFSVSQWNGYKTIATSSGSTITITQGTSGSSVSGYITKAVTNTTALYKRAHVVVSRLDNGHTCMLGKMHPSTNASYSQLSLPAISPDGSKVSINSGFGFPGEVGTWEIKTCFQGWRRGMRANDFVVNEPGARYGLDVIPQTGALLVRVSTPLADGACSINYGTTTDYSGATNQTLAAGSKFREHTISGLSAGDVRYVNAVCEGTDAEGVRKQRWHYATAEGQAR